MLLKLAFSAVLGVAMFAQEHDDHGPRGRGGPGGGRGRGMMMPPSMRIVDANGDGVIDATEIKNSAQAFAKLDANSDGKLAAEEFRPAFGPPPGMGRGPGPGGPEGRRPEGGGPEGQPGDPTETVNILMRFDKDGDGKLTKAEVPERMQGIFARADANKDSVLTKEELMQSARQQEQQTGRGGEREGRRGPGGPGGMMRFDPVLRELDANGDGEIAASEWKKAPAVLSSLDKNRDGQITPDELRPEMPARQ